MRHLGRNLQPRQEGRRDRTLRDEDVAQELGSTRLDDRLASGLRQCEDWYNRRFDWQDADLDIQAQLEISEMQRANERDVALVGPFFVRPTGRSRQGGIRG